MTQLSTTTIDLEKAGELVEIEQGNSKGEFSLDLEHPNDEQLESLCQNIACNQEYLVLVEQNQELRQQQEAITQVDYLLDKIAILTTLLIVLIVTSTPSKQLYFNKHKTKYISKNFQELQ